MAINELWKLLLVMSVFCVISQTVGQNERLGCGRRKLKTVYLIHHGTDATAGHWPWHVAIFHEKEKGMEYACGGSIIDENTVVTAAHCVINYNGPIPKRRMSVHVGRTNLKQENEYTRIHYVQELIAYTGFTKDSIANDIALIKLTTNITMSKYVQPVCLWTMDNDLHSIVGQNGTVVGFGLMEKNVLSDHLKQALVNIMEPLVCIASNRPMYGTHLTTEMFCGKGQNGVSACNGDSGGGIFLEVGGKWFIRGLVSFIPELEKTSLCDNTQHTVYTDVAKYVGWITQYIDERVLHNESVIDVDYEEKLRLLNFDTCGVFLRNDDKDERFSPWVGIIYPSSQLYSGNIRCMVTLISEWYAVGPAHCFPNDGLKLSVDLSHSRIRQAVGEIQRVILHPKYNNTSFENDIAMIELFNPANVSDPDTKPTCLPVTPDIRTDSYENLTATLSSTFLSLLTNHDTTPADYVNNTYCKAMYDREGVTVFQESNRFCARITDPVFYRTCGQSPAGAPLTQLRTFGKIQRHFLRGFELFKQSCDPTKPSVYVDVNEYLDWMLYNMRYNEPETVEDVHSTSNLESDWSTFQQEQNEELLYVNDCGVGGPFDQTLKQFTYLSWIGRVHEQPDITVADLKLDSIAILINHRYALASASTMVNRIHWRYSTFGSLGTYLGCDRLLDACDSYKKMIENKQITVHPDYATHPHQYDIALIEFLGSIYPLDDYVSPICLPLTESLRETEPLQLAMSTVKLFVTESRRLRQLDAASCQQRFVQYGFSYRHENGSICTVHSDDERQAPVSVLAGSPLQSLIQLNGRKRYFLRGFKYSKNTGTNVYLPLIFTDVHPHIEWIVERIGYNKRKTLLYRVGNSSATTDDVSDDPIVYNSPFGKTTKQRDLNFDTCGTSEYWNVSGQVVSIANPWYVNVESDDIAVVNPCAVTLISEWYVLGLASCLDGLIRFVLLIIGLSYERFQIERPVRHPQYDARNPVHNIAIAALTRPFQYNHRNINAICLPVIDAVRSSGYKRSQLLTIGRLDGVDELMVATVGDRYTDSKHCQKSSNNTICIYSPPLNGQESYFENIGSPVFSIHLFNGVKRYFLRGIALNTISTFPLGVQPGAYLEIDPYLDWILENMNKTPYVRDLSNSLNERSGGSWHSGAQNGWIWWAIVYTLLLLYLWGN